MRAVNEKYWADRAARLARNLAKFEKENPDFANWWANTEFPFAISLREAVAKYGGLTSAQLAAGRKCIAGLNEAKQIKCAEAADRHKEAAPLVDSSGLMSALQRAKAAKLKGPKIVVEILGNRYTFTLAPANGTNPGAIYVSRNGDWIGKLVDGHYVQVAEGDDATEAVRIACRDIRGAAVAYGRKTGVCSCCGRELTDPVSVEKGIGPICEGKYFG